MIGSEWDAARANRTSKFSHLMQRTSSSWPSNTRIHAPHSISHNLIELSDDPDTTSRSLYWRQAIPRLWPFNVRTNSHVAVDQTLIVLSPDAETMYLSSKSTTLTAARWPTRTRRKLISEGLTMSHTAMLRSWTHKHTFTVPLGNDFENTEFHRAILIALLF